jgi:magnesium chelatase subunit H
MAQRQGRGNPRCCSGAGRRGLAYQNLESVELGVTTVDHYFDTLGGIARAVKRARGGTEAAVYIGDQTRGAARSARCRTGRAGNPLAQPEPEILRGPAEARPEGVRQIEAQVTNTLGWSATTGRSSPGSTSACPRPSCWTRRCAAAGRAEPAGLARMANRLLEASRPQLLAARRRNPRRAAGRGADEIEDRMEGIAAE